MQGKYQTWRHLLSAYGIREYVRARLIGAVGWEPLRNPEPGCTAIIGMCHRLPNVLLANLRCLVSSSSAWTDLREIIIVVDGVRGCVPREIEAAAIALGGSKVNVRVEYYSVAQARLTDELRLPYVFSWLSWSIGLSQCVTKTALLHDYDALVFGSALERRYSKFVESNAAVQGIRWYVGSGVEAEDRLATTFEMFVDVPWIRQHPPRRAFHKVRYRQGRSFDYDTTLDLQHNFTPESRRAVMAMDEEEMVHPSQMIHQYTMFTRYPGKELPCYSIPMIPFFEFLSGRKEAIGDAVARLSARKGPVLDFIGDGTSINTAALLATQVDWALKQMVRACLKSKILPFAELYRYGECLYEIAGAPAEKSWVGDFSPEQTSWIEESRRLARGSA